MPTKRLWLFAAGVLAVSSVIWWPAQRADVSVLFEQAGRPERPPHPIEIYRPPAGK